MAPLASPFPPTKRSNSSTSGSSSHPSLSLAAVIGIGVAIAFVASLAAAAALYRFYFRPRAASRAARPRSHVGNAMKHDVASSAPWQPRNRLGRVLAVLSPKRRKSKTNLSATIDFTLSDVNLEPLQLPDTKLAELPTERRSSAAEPDGGLFGDGKVLFGAEDESDIDPFERLSRDADVLGPLPLSTASARQSAPAARRSLRAIKSEQYVSLTTQYRTSEPSARPDRESLIDKLALEMPPVTTGTQAAWHRKRTGPPPPLTIAPPVHSRSPSDAQSAYSTYTAPSSPYEYYSFNIPVPSIPSPLRTASPKNPFSDDQPYSADSLHSASSARSDNPLCQPTSPHSPASVPSMSRSDSGARTESTSLPPPTPTYSPSGSHSPTQSQRVPIDSTNFVCLGPLPNGFSMPVPGQFQTKQQAPRPVPSVCVPSEVSRVRTFSKSSLDVTSPLVNQDPLLHDNNPFPHRNPVNPTFTREHSAHAHKCLDNEPPRQRRPSVDSLGSNFTVEEEARIQAQIVKNLSMIGKERVGGGNDIVHIPQISNKRYSWEN